MNSVGGIVLCTITKSCMAEFNNLIPMSQIERETSQSVRYSVGHGY